MMYALQIPRGKASQIRVGVLHVDRPADDLQPGRRGIQTSHKHNRDETEEGCCYCGEQALRALVFDRATLVLIPCIWISVTLYEYEYKFSNERKMFSVFWIYNMLTSVFCI